MPWNRFVLGYHGCDRSIMNDILTGKSGLQASRNDYDWLGNGVYFWEDSNDPCRLVARYCSRAEKRWKGL